MRLRLRHVVEQAVRLAHALDERLYDWLVSPMERRTRVRKLAFLRSYADYLRMRVATLHEIPGSKFATDKQAELMARSYDRQIACSAYRRDWNITRAQRILHRLWFPAFLVVAYLLLADSPELSFEVVGLISFLASLPIALLVYGVSRRILFRLFYDRQLRLAWGRRVGWLTALLAVAVLWVAFAFGRWQIGFPRWLIAALALGLLASAIDLLCFLAGALYYDFVHFTWTWEGYYRAPDAFMVSRLMNAAVSVWRSPERWHELRFRDTASYDIEICARCIEYYVPRVLGPYDAEMREWQVTETRRIAAGIRKLKTLLILPAPTSREDLLEKMLDILYPIVVGDWRSLERIEPAEVRAHPPRPTLRRRILDLSAALIRAAIPLVLAVVATQIDFGTLGRPLVTGPIANYLLGVTALYSAVALVMAIDPQLAARVRTAREILGMIPPQGRKEGDEDRHLHADVGGASKSPSQD